MIDPTVARLRADIEARGAEIYASRESGFLPAHRDARGTPSSEFTLDPLSAQAPPESRFVVADARGRQSFTRDGSFTCANGLLQTHNGEPVLGYRPGATLLTPLQLPNTDRMLGRVENLHLERDGKLIYERQTIDPRTNSARRERVTVGTVALARFPAGTEPLRSGNLERAPIGIDPLLGAPGDGHFANLHLRHHESGALNLNAALARLHDAYQQLDAVTAAQKAGRDTVKTVMDLVK